VDGIVNVELTPKWRELSIDRYDDSTDPDKHIDVYTTDIGLFTTSEAIMCRVFPNNLKGMALSWFTKLPPYSIDSFKTLVNLFTTQFATNRSHHLTSIALVNSDKRGTNLFGHSWIDSTKSPCKYETLTQRLLSTTWSRP